jgi:hypothetical protein
VLVGHWRWWARAVGAGQGGGDLNRLGGVGGGLDRLERLDE